ncbi:hypothetical protein NpNSSI1_00003473 [Neofusicoccum parvum]|nr:hypothetical protein NpNSSI1_00003473 [Neofusicoccum parvum]
MYFSTTLGVVLPALFALVQALGCQQCLGLNNHQELANLCKVEVEKVMGKGATELQTAKENCDNFFVDYECCYPGPCRADGTCLNPSNLFKHSLIDDRDPDVLNHNFASTKFRARDDRKATCCSFARVIYETFKTIDNANTFQEKKKAMMYFGGKI